MQPFGGAWTFLMMYYTYIIRSIPFPDKTYVGFSENLKNRLEEHNQGKSKYTSHFKPWNLIFYSAFDSKQKAMDFEKYLKSHSGNCSKNLANQSLTATNPQTAPRRKQFLDKRILHLLPTQT